MDGGEYEIPAPLEEPKHRKGPTLAVRCRNCIHFRRQRAKAFKDVCEKLGVKGESRACSYFFANPFYFKRKEEEFKVFEDMVRDLPRAQVQSLIGWMQQELVTRRSGFAFGQTVYVRMVGDDYLRNYAKGIVVSADKTHVFIQGDEKRVSATMTLMKDSVFSEEKWKKKRAALIARGRVRDPNASKIFSAREARKRTAQEDVPTIDDFNKRVAKVSPKKIKKGRRIGSE